jgi:hypothetical protein
MTTRVPVAAITWLSAVTISRSRALRKPGRSNSACRTPGIGSDTTIDMLGAIL